MDRIGPFRFNQVGLTLKARACCIIRLVARNSVLPSSALSITTVLLVGVLAAGPALAQSELLDVVETPAQEAVAEVILPEPIQEGMGLCPELAGMERLTADQQDLLDRCSELVVNAIEGNDLDSVRRGLEQMAQLDVTAQGTNSVEISRNQFANLAARLAAIRGGAVGISVQGLALSLSGQRVSDTMIASLSPHIFSGAVSGDEPSPFSKLGVFLNGSVSFGDKDRTSRELGFDFKTYGVTAGVDYMFTNSFVLGLALGYASTDVDLDLSGGGLDTHGYSASVYASYYPFDELYIDGIVTFGWIDFDTKRNISYSIPALDGGVTVVDQTAKGDTDATLFALAFNVGYDISRSGFTFGPFVRFSYTRTDIDGYTEKIGGEGDGLGLALDIHSQDIESLTTALGGRASYAISTQWGVLLPQLMFEWEHEYQDDSRIVTANFAADPTPSDDTLIKIRTDSPDRDFFNLGFGLSAVFPRGVSSFIYYETVLGLDDIVAHFITGGLRIEL
ncbi:MAG: autotransporter outer membrane beta-barrel domain-containing protein [Thermodesulfobacteriota bacterium]